MTEIRKILSVILGHVDHGKTSILDRIRGTAIAAKEAGGITQEIGCTAIPIDTIQKVCGDLLEALKMDIKIPGILILDTPGHAAFTSLRKRGGNLADIAILVIDINEGFKPQTQESIEILKQSKTPFVIVANKLDLVHGWQTSKEPFIANYEKQQPHVRADFDKKMYEIVGQLYERFQINADRFDRIDDYTKSIAIIPCSAQTGEGIPELLMVLTGLAQRFLEKGLHVDLKGPAKGTVIEVKEEKGLGKTLDIIIYDGSLKVNDQIIIGGINGPIVTKVKAMFEPAPLVELREKKSKFKSVKEVVAAAGVKLVAKDIEDAVSGMPVMAASGNIDEIKKQIEEEIKAIMVETEELGIVIKADSLGSLEALTTLLKAKNIPIKKAGIGDITKRDISVAEANFEQDPLLSAVLGFNISHDESLSSEHVKILTHDVIYRLIEDFEKWQEQETKKIQHKELDLLARPFKLNILRGYVFRQNNPAVFGVEIVAGTLRPNSGMMKSDGKLLATIKSVQLEQKNVEKAEKGKQVAISVPHITVGRQVNEGDVLYSFIPEQDFRKLKEFKEFLSEEEKEVLREIAKMMRNNNPVWGV